VPEDRNLKEALIASALLERGGSCDETSMSYVTRKELHVLGTLFIGARLPCGYGLKRLGGGAAVTDYDSSQRAG